MSSSVSTGGQFGRSRDGWRWRAPQATFALLLTLALWLACTGIALAATETTIGFDNFPGGASVSSGTVVTEQWKSEGLELGTSSALKGPSPGSGDCGSPTVAGEHGPSGVPAASSPNYAVLPKCVGSTIQGTYGALLGHPRGSLSVKVRNLLASGPPVKVTVIGYSAAGKEVAKGVGEAIGGTWQTIAAALSGEGGVSFFSIRTPGGPGEVAIDDLAYEAEPASKEPPGEEPPGEEHKAPPVEPPGSTPPAAALSVTTTEPKAGAPLTLSGAGSQAGSGARIISYGWDFNGDGAIDTSTGTDPTAHVILPPGTHTIGLTITNSKGEKSSSRDTLTLPSVHIHPPDGGEGECLPSLEIGDAHLLAECIQKLSGGGYVIAGPELDLNGMMLVPKSGGFMKIKTVQDFAVGGAATELYGAQVDVELLNTPIGDMVLGERDLEAEPINLELKVAPRLKYLGPISHGFRGRAHAAEDERPSKFLLMAIGVGKECEAKDSKKAGCCPPKNGNTACATLPGGFPLSGQIDVYITNKQQALFDVQVGLNLSAVKFEATGALEIRANLEKGIELQSLQFEIGEANLAPIFKVKKASFVYYFPEYEEESKRDSWQAKATMTFGEEIAELEAELSFKKGEFHSAAMKFKAKPGVPIYPGVALNEIGASIEVNPLAFGGSLGASIAELLELELAFKFREETSTELGFFGGEGKLTLKEDEIATIAADVYTDGYIDANVKFNLHFPFDSDEPLVKVLGEAGFWDEPASGLWQAKGYVYVKLWEISAEVAALVNNQYIAGCVQGEVFGVSGGIQGRYRISDGNIDGGLFAGNHCTDQLKQYSQKPLKKHSGGFVKEESSLLFPRSAGALGHELGALAPSARTAASGESDGFTLPAGTSGEELRVSSTAGTPVFTVTGPGGQSFATPPVGGHVVGASGQYLAAIAPDHDQVLVLLMHPAGGEWHIQPAPGSPAIFKLEVAEDVPPATVRTHVHHKRGRFTLAYSIDHYVPGTKVRFVERGRDSTHVLGTVASAHGALRFAPQQALSRARTIYAYLLDAEGATVRELTAGRYTAPSASRPARPRHLRIARHGTSALVSWSAVGGARTYRIKVVGSDGRLETLTRKPGSRSVTIPNALSFESFTVKVSAVGGPDRLAGPATSAKLAPVRLRTPVRHRRKRHH